MSMYKKVGKDLWFCFTMMTGKADESAISDEEPESVAFLVMGIATVFSLLFLIAMQIVAALAYGDATEGL